MIVFLNGQFVPEEKAVVSVLDRGFLYGDGLFESIRVYGGIPFRWPQHLARLQRGAEFLNLRSPFSADELRQFADQLVTHNHLPEALLRLTLSRGIGPRGYSPRGADQPNLIMTLHPTPRVDRRNLACWKLVTASLRVPAKEKLNAFKTCNKLPQILARAEAEAQGADEALLLNTDGEVAEAASSNLFWIANGAVCTTPLESGILAGVTRSIVLELCASLGIPAREIAIKPEALRRADGLFLSLSTLGIVEVISLDDHNLECSPVTEQIRVGYDRLVRAETV